MRISDWSSDVCSSDLLDNVYVRTERYSRQSKTKFYQLSGRLEQRLTDSFKLNLLGGFSKSRADIPVETTLAFADTEATGYHYDRSEEHTSELQSLMLTPSAVFSLEKKTTRTTH